MEIFQTFAELSVGILGFTAIVIMFKNQHSKWNKHIFDGMISHGAQALIYSILPFVLVAYHCKTDTVWITCSAVLGTVTFLQGFMVLIADKVSKMRTKIIMLVFSTTVAVLQFLNIIGVGTTHESGPFIIGVAWHIAQSLVIFTMIVTRKPENDQPMG